MTMHASVAREADSLTFVEQQLAAAPTRTARTRADTDVIALTVTARAIVAAALARCETRGSHQRRDRPDTDPSQARSIVVRLAEGRVVVDAPVAAGACG
jgi:L-aspartate oxidase